MNTIEAASCHVAGNKKQKIQSGLWAMHGHLFELQLPPKKLPIPM